MRVTDSARRASTGELSPVETDRKNLVSAGKTNLATGEAPTYHIHVEFGMNLTCLRDYREECLGPWLGWQGMRIPLSCDVCSPSSACGRMISDLVVDRKRFCSGINRSPLPTRYRGPPTALSAGALESENSAHGHFEDGLDEN
jgi:hypothetical protein